MQKSVDGIIRKPTKPVRQRRRVLKTSTEWLAKVRSSKRIRFNKKVTTWFLAGLVVFTAGLVIIIVNQSSSGPFPSYIKKQAHFTLYYPKHMVIEKNSMQLTGGKLLSYTADYQGKQFYVTEQLRPSGFNFTSFSGQLTDSTQFLNSYGTATLGQLNGRLVGSLVTPNTWVLISTTLNTNNTDLSQIIQQLVKN